MPIPRKMCTSAEGALLNVRLAQALRCAKPALTGMSLILAMVLVFLFAIVEKFPSMGSANLVVLAVTNASMCKTTARYALITTISTMPLLPVPAIQPPVIRCVLRVCTFMTVLCNVCCSVPQIRIFLL